MISAVNRVFSIRQSTRNFMFATFRPTRSTHTGRRAEDLLQNIFGHLQCAVDVSVGMAVADVAALQVQGNLENAAFDHAPTVRDETSSVVTQQVGVAFDGTFHEVSEEH